MGSVLTKVLDPTPLDNSIRHFWHVDGVIIDAATVGPSTQNNSASLDVLSPGIGGDKSKRNRRKSSRGFLAKLGTVQRRPPGVLFIYEGRLCYKSRRCGRCWCGKAKPFQVDIADVLDVNGYEQFTSQKDGKVYSGRVVDVQVIDTEDCSNTIHLGFLTRQADQVSRQLKDTLTKHRQKPKIFQFNSIDVEGVEVDVP